MEQINNQLNTLSLKQKLRTHLKRYLETTLEIELSPIYSVLDLLKQKYVADFNIIEKFRTDIVEYTRNTTNKNMNNLNCQITICNNRELINDLVDFLDYKG